MSQVLQAFGLALVSLFHPRMLVLLFLPLVVALLFWIGVAWWIWEPLTGWLHAVAANEMPGAISQLAVVPWLAAFGSFAIAVLAVLLLAPLMFALAMMLMSVVAQPIVSAFLTEEAWSEVTREGRWSLLGGIRNALYAAGVFLLGYLLTLPLWLFPVLGLLVPWFWWGWLTARVLRHDSLAEHATAAERDALIARHRGKYLLMGLLVTVPNYIFPLFLVTPVLSALAFGHLSFALLLAHRRPTETLLDR